MVSQNRPQQNLRHDRKPPDWSCRASAHGACRPYLCIAKLARFCATPSERPHCRCGAPKGADAWFDEDPQNFLGAKYAAADYERVTDILDVWFDSGVTHAFVLEARDDLQWPADVYLEGSDQHRGWFHSSLLEACATRGQAPYKQVVTHGFTMDEKGRKMSKSMGIRSTRKKLSSNQVPRLSACG